MSTKSSQATKKTATRRSGKSAYIAQHDALKARRLTIVPPSDGGIWLPPSQRVAAAKPIFTYDLAYAFPAVDAGMRPFGSRILVQIARPMTRSAGGIELIPDTQDTQKWNAVVAKVIAIGPLAFHNRDTLAPWPEGDWCKVGDFVWTPQYGGQRHERPLPGTTEKIMFRLMDDLNMLGASTIDPLEVLSFL